MANILSDIQDGQDFVGGMVQGVAKRRAGAKLAQRDYAGAAGDLYGAGLLREGANVQDIQDSQEDRALSMADDERKRQLAEATARVGYVKQVAQSLGQVPPEKRNEAFEHVVPAFQSMGLPDEVIDQMRQAPKDDATLQAFGATLDNELKLFSTRDGIVAVQPRTGDARLAYKVTPDPLDAALKEGRLNLMDAQAKRALRAPAGRSGSSRAISEYSDDELLAMAKGLK